MVAGPARLDSTKAALSSPQPKASCGRVDCLLRCDPRETDYFLFIVELSDYGRFPVRVLFFFLVFSSSFSDLRSYSECDISYQENSST